MLLFIYSSADFASQTMSPSTVVLNQTKKNKKKDKIHRPNRMTSAVSTVNPRSYRMLSNNNSTKCQNTACISLFSHLNSTTLILFYCGTSEGNLTIVNSLELEFSWLGFCLPTGHSCVLVRFALCGYVCVCMGELCHDH